MQSLTAAIVDLEEFRKSYEKGFIKENYIAALALAIFIPLLVIGGLWLQIAMGLLAMLGVMSCSDERVKHHDPEGLLSY